MKKILPLVFVAILFFASFSFAKAQTLNGITKYPEGTCMDNGGNGLWQQNADGTWSPPNDEWNRCQNQWQNNGTNTNNSPWQRTDQYPWGTNYPGGYTNYNDYFINCVLAQSLVARPECQAFPRTGSTYLPNGTVANPILILSTKIGNSTVAVAISQGEKAASAVSRGLLGWTLGILIQ